MAKHYQIVKHGIEYPDYWQGYGAYGTGWESVATGVGETEIQAYNDALEQMAVGESSDAMSKFVNSFPVRPKGIGSKPVPKKYGEDAQYYVSILYGG